MARRQAAAIAAKAFALDPVMGEGWFDFETTTARCKGYVRLSGGRCTMLLTAMTELKGFEEPAGVPADRRHRAPAVKGRRTWLDERQAQARSLGHDRQPYCLIVGGGQGGLALAARLKRLGVPTLIIDALERPGDAWRSRYKSLYLHDPIWLDHFPYLPFPDHWPLYTSKDKMGDWLEIYAKVMELDFWGSTVCRNARFDEAADEWVVAVERAGQTLTLRPKQLVFATGLSGGKHVPDIPGAERFEGEQHHSADHVGGENLTGKRCVVIGSNNSAHDICVDLWENDAASVTMIQRSPTIVVRASTMGELSADIPYAKPDIPTDAADLMSATMTYRQRTALEINSTNNIRAIDAEFYERLAASGFLLSTARTRPASSCLLPAGGRLLHRRRRLRPHRARRDRRADGQDRRDRTPRRPHGRRRHDPGRHHRLRHRLPADGRMDRQADLSRGRAEGRPLLGARLGHRRRSRPLGGRAAQHVEAHPPARPVVPGRQPRPVALPFPPPSAADQGADGGPAHARLLAQRRDRADARAGAGLNATRLTRGGLNCRPCSTRTRT